MSQAAFHPITAKVLSGKAPPALADAVARGVVPIPPYEILLLRVHLAKTSPPAIASVCRQHLADQPSHELAALVEQPSCPTHVLEYLVKERGADTSLMETVVRHQAVSARALGLLASASQPEVLERLLDNPERLLCLPDLLESLERNPALPGPARARLVDLKEELARRARRLKGSRPAAEARPAGAADLPPAAGAPTQRPESRLPEGDEGVAETPVAETPAAEPLQETEGGQDLAPPEEFRGEAFQRIMQLSVPDRMQLAMKGNREERIILVRDKVKMVSLAVLKSPKLTEPEIENIAAMRSVVDEVIHSIAANREWTKSYGVVHALCRNPKAPVRKVLTLMTRLNNRDLKLLITDRGVPEVIRTNARRFFLARTEPKKIRVGKH
ncbi:MAG: hypothetical protein ACE5ID_01240 [Acidobacteriota bacterium]